MHMTATLNRLGAPLRYTEPWTPRQEEQLRKQLHTKGYRAMALELKRTIDAVKWKARELGLTKKWGCE